MISALPRRALSLSIGIAMLAGCSGSQGALAPAPAPQSIGAGSLWGGEVQYFTTSNEALEYNYPKSESPIGEITGLSGPGGECTKGAKTFWITENEQVAEFKAGGTTPIATHNTGGSGCAVDPTTGDLAVTTLSGDGVVIYKPGSNSGRTVSSGLIETYFDGYDGAGNLYVDGFNQSDESALAELPHGKRKFKALTLSNSVEFPGAVQYDGTYITVNDQEAHNIYGYTCSGTSCTLEQTVSLSGSSDCVQTWIAQPYVYCPDAGLGEGLVYKYPAGGSPVATLTGLYLPLGAVSLRAR